MARAAVAPERRSYKGREAFCTLLDPKTPLADLCLSAGLLPAEFCGLLGDGA